MSQQHSIRSASGQSSMTFLPERGGMAHSLKLQGRELLYLHDFFYQQPTWDDLPGGWPFCFPVCARQILNGQAGCYQHAGTTYHMPIHGFAWQRPWQVIAETTDQISLVLTDDAVSRSMYPFSFRIQLDYHISDSQLTCLQTYRNCGQQSMPYTSGFHPYFKTPWPTSEKSKVRLHFKPQQHLHYSEDLYQVLHASNVKNNMTCSITDPHINEQLFRLDPTHHYAELQFPDQTRLQLEVHAVDHNKLGSTASDIANEPMFNYLQLYTMHDKDFFCLEPWNGQPNALNSGQGLRILPANTQEQAMLQLKLLTPETSS